MIPLKPAALMCAAALIVTACSSSTTRYVNQGGGDRQPPAQEPPIWSVSLGEEVAPERSARRFWPARSSPRGVTWTARTDATGAAVDSAIKDEAVVYTNRKLISAGDNGDDEFKLRGLTVRGQLHAGPDETGDLEFHGGVEGGSTGGVDNADLGVTKDDGVGTAAGNELTWQRTDARVLSSIQLRRDGGGFTMKMGGPGVIFYDMERRTALGPQSGYSNAFGNGACANEDDAKCDDHTTSDVTAVFDTPAIDPDGEASYHFSMIVKTRTDVTPIVETRAVNEHSSSGVSPDAAKAPWWVAFSDDQNRRAYRVNPDYAGVVDLGADGAVGGGDDTTGYANLAGEEYTDPADGSKYKVLWLSHAIAAPTGAMLLEYRRANRIANGLPADELGVYTVKLSNYAGVDDKGTDDESDDEHRYLKYAAYGLFNFLDYSGSPWFSRMQAFHFGYDAFGGANGEPKDFSTDEVTATFNGKTTAWILQNPTGNAGNISQLVRLRGDVTLEATLGGGSSNGAIEGSMENFEFLQSGVWSKLPHSIFGHSNDATTDGVTLESADIGADGSYAGVARTTETANARFEEGRYGGAFYGPRTLGELETAGYWMLPRHIGDPSSLESCPSGRTGPACVTFGTIIGSFGAVSEPAP